jgi:phosphoribosylanthranilate isomerase
MSTMIKVCGMREEENIRDLILIKPSLIGLILFPGSSRFVKDPQKLADIFSEERSFQLVGVFVNEQKSRILELHKLLNFDLIQLHGQESPSFCEDLKSMGLKIIKVFGIDCEEDFSRTAPYANSSDFFLFDTLTSTHGGSGRKFDWSLLDSYKGKVPFFLSGGIGPEDKPAIDHPCFAGIDLNSRFEVSPGLKDIDLLSRYFKNIRNGQ